MILVITCPVWVFFKYRWLSVRLTAHVPTDLNVSICFLFPISHRSRNRTGVWGRKEKSSLMHSQNCKIQICLRCGLFRPLPLKSSPSSNRSENTQYGLSISGGETLAILSLLRLCLLGGFSVAHSLIATKDATESGLQ